jgi:hypothetical protein
MPEEHHSMYAPLNELRLKPMRDAALEDLDTRTHLRHRTAAAERYLRK